ncbi:thiamine diphosphokinase [Thalassobacillus pellis]|uniref:thiamine diphosphokinase n=1 Tax=Thalassobacillus pellis TaxID=748008 RepID=UPI00196044FE|nr:thiamine diphosphokinase [Thalassobacillus pellis]MBM7552806.1 thiamine pyrophosphokinase [Thalassobacillus pellis]
MNIIAIIGGGPKRYIPDLQPYYEETVHWIGADRGAEVLLERGVPITKALGDFDSVTSATLKQIKAKAAEVDVYPEEKDDTDLEIAVMEAMKMKPDKILLFGVTGGRIDHTLANIQLLYTLLKAEIPCTIIDTQNQMELTSPGTHAVTRNTDYPYISFLPLTMEVTGLHLEGFYYPLENNDLPIGSTLCMSNKLVKDIGTFSYTQGILLLIRSRDI